MLDRIELKSVSFNLVKIKNDSIWESSKIYGFPYLTLNLNKDGKKEKKIKDPKKSYLGLRYDVYRKTLHIYTNVSRLIFGTNCCMPRYYTFEDFEASLLKLLDEYVEIYGIDHLRVSSFEYNVDVCLDALPIKMIDHLNQILGKKHGYYKKDMKVSTLKVYTKSSKIKVYDKYEQMGGNTDYNCRNLLRTEMTIAGRAQKAKKFYGKPILLYQLFTIEGLCQTHQIFLDFIDRELLYPIGESSGFDSDLIKDIAEFCKEENSGPGVAFIGLLISKCRHFPFEELMYDLNEILRLLNRKLTSSTKSKYKKIYTLASQKPEFIFIMKYRKLMEAELNRVELIQRGETDENDLIPWITGGGV